MVQASARSLVDTGRGPSSRDSDGRRCVDDDGIVGGLRRGSSLARLSEPSGNSRPGDEPTLLR